MPRYLVMAPTTVWVVQEVESPIVTGCVIDSDGCPIPLVVCPWCRAELRQVVGTLS